MAYRKRFQATRRSRFAAVAAFAVLVLASCESEVAAPPEVFEEGVLSINATTPGGFAYARLGNPGSAVTPSDPDSSTDWHMAFRRFSIRLNGGVAGPGSVAGFNLGNNADLTAEQVAALTEEDGQAAFEAVGEADVPAAASFAEDGLAPDPGASWFRFDPRTRNIVANPGAAWKLRESSQRGYALFRVSEIEMQGQRPVGVSVEYRRHDPSGSLGAAATIALDLRTGPAFLGFAQGAAASPAGCGWDIGVTPDFAIRVNADCGAGTFPLDAGQDFAAETSAGDAPDYGGFLATVSGAFPSTVDDAGGFFWYNIRENSRMWPTYNVFLVRADDRVYKVQIIDYYDAGGDSGHPKLRYRRLR